MVVVVAWAVGVVVVMGVVAGVVGVVVGVVVFSMLIECDCGTIICIYIHIVIITKNSIFIYCMKSGTYFLPLPRWSLTFFNSVTADCAKSTACFKLILSPLISLRAVSLSCIAVSLSCLAFLLSFIISCIFFAFLHPSLCIYLYVYIKIIV
jgi:hypothetical protein